jgi:2-phospho-L-lactate guanylyltransferase (CobY/MobA/RfbA family)
MPFYNPVTRLFSLLETILANQQKERTLLSALSDAITSLKAANAAEHEEVSLVLDKISADQADLKAAVEAALAKGATPEELADVQSVIDQQTADTEKMKAALASPPTTTVSTAG